MLPAILVPKTNDRTRIISSSSKFYSNQTSQNKAKVPFPNIKHKAIILLFCKCLLTFTLLF